MLLGGEKFCALAKCKCKDTTRRLAGILVINNTSFSCIFLKDTQQVVRPTPGPQAEEQDRLPTNELLCFTMESTNS